MVIAEIRGGLGNQMFQYAFAKHLAIKNNVELKLDISLFRYDPLRSYELDSLSIEAMPLTPVERAILRVSRTERFPTLGKLAQLVHGGGPVRVLVDRQNGYDAEAEAQVGNIYLRGYWQSWKYFDDIKPCLLREFAVSLPRESWESTMMVRILGSSAVCVHVRRGDYLGNKNYASTFGPCDVGYYQAAICRIQESVANPVFFVFTEDPDWAKKQFGIRNDFVYLDYEHRRRPAADLRLMTSCRHFIISNSTFGWWAAWLSDTANKIVISPQKWYKADWKTNDLLPPGWTILPNELV